MKTWAAAHSLLLFLLGNRLVGRRAARCCVQSRPHFGDGLGLRLLLVKFNQVIGVRLEAREALRPRLVFNLDLASACQHLQFEGSKPLLVELCREILDLLQALVVRVGEVCLALLANTLDLRGKLIVEVAVEGLLVLEKFDLNLC